MRITSTNRWEFDMPSGAVLTVTEHEAAVWLDGLIRDNAEIVRLRAELAEAVKVVKLVQAERDALRQVLDGFSGPPPTLLQWKMICGRAKEVASAIDKAREGA